VCARGETILGAVCVRIGEHHSDIHEYNAAEQASDRVNEAVLHCELRHLVVRPEHRGKGIGRRLIQAAEAHCADIAKEPTCSATGAALHLSTLSVMHSALHLYCSLGFEEVRRNSTGDLTIISMCKNIPL
jgi:GNAT superfamily N-acetyltransferase